MPPPFNQVPEDKIEDDDTVDHFQKNDKRHDIRSGSNSKGDFEPHFPTKSKSSRNGPSLRKTAAEVQYFPNYASEKNSEAIPIPHAHPPRSLAMGGVQPRNTLHAPLGSNNTRKRSVPESGRNRSQREKVFIMDDLEEPSINSSENESRKAQGTKNKNNGQRITFSSKERRAAQDRARGLSKAASEIGSSPPTTSSGDSRSQYFSRTTKSQNPSTTAEETAVERFFDGPEGLPAMNAQAPSRSLLRKSSEQRWSSGNNWTHEPPPPRSHTQKKRGLVSSSIKSKKQPQIHLFCSLSHVTWGANHLSGEKDLAIELSGKKGAGHELEIYFNSQPQKVNIVDVEKAYYEIGSGTPTNTFGLLMNQNRCASNEDSFIEFGLKDSENVEKMKEALIDCGIKLEDKNRLDDLRNRFHVQALRRIHEQKVVRNAEEQISAMGLQNVTQSQMTSPRSVATKPVVVMPPKPQKTARKSIRINKTQPTETATEERSSKRSLSLDDTNPYETRSAKVPKLELPQPQWRRPLLYPFEGPKRANVDYEDLDRLNNCEFLNDNLINFYLRYIEETLRERDPKLARETHFLNTFFYERLTMKTEKGKRRIDGVLKWTAKIDLFEKNYVIVPINESSHWYLAIICNLKHLNRKLQKEPQTSLEEVADDSDVTMAGQDMSKDEAALIAQESDTRTDVSEPAMEKDSTITQTRDGLENMSIDDEWPQDDELQGVDLLKAQNETGLPGPHLIDIDAPEPVKIASKAKTKGKAKDKPKKKPKAIPPDTPVIFILDSMGPNRPGAIRNIRDWLTAEALNKRTLEITKEDVVAINAKVPNQTNWYDCGLYVLWYVEQFLKQPTEFVKAFLEKEDFSDNADFWPEGEVAKMRDTLFKKIVQLHDEYEEHEKKKAVVTGKKSPVVKDKSPPSRDLKVTALNQPQVDAISAVDVPPQARLQDQDGLNESPEPSASVLKTATEEDFPPQKPHSLEPGDNLSTKAKASGMHDDNPSKVAQSEAPPEAVPKNVVSVSKGMLSEANLQVKGTKQSSASPISTNDQALYKTNHPMS